VKFKESLTKTSRGNKSSSSCCCWAVT